MGSKEIEITCPCCAARITVDAATGKTLRSREAKPGGKTDAWESAQENVRQRTTRGADKLESALENERGKADRLDELFRKAQEKTRGRGDDDSA
jgi:hypothetical protein